MRVSPKASNQESLASEVEFQTASMANPGTVLAAPSLLTAFQIERVLRNPHGSLAVYLPPALAEQCDLQISDDLVTWRVLTNATVDPDGNLVFTDKPDPQIKRRFYRAVSRAQR